MNDYRAEIERVQGLYSEYEEVSGFLRIDELVVPMNLQQEKHRFLDTYEHSRLVRPPSFEYGELNDRTELIEAAHRIIRRCGDDRSLAANRLARTIEDTLSAQDEGQIHDPDLVTQRTEARYGRPDDALLAAAERFASPEQIASETPSVTADEAAERFRSVLSELKLSTWYVEVSTRMSARMSVNGGLRRLRLRSDAVFTRSEVRRLLVHEIGTHVLRYEAGLAQPASFLRGGSIDYLEAEEGLACFNEDKWGVASPESFRTYACRVIAAETALDGGFADVFTRLLEYLDPARAFDIAVRSKRGFSDVEQPGAHLKDIVYLRGYLSVREGAEPDGEADRRLRYGKVGFSDYELIDELHDHGLLTEPPLTCGDVAALASEDSN